MPMLSNANAKPFFINQHQLILVPKSGILRELIVGGGEWGAQKWFLGTEHNGYIYCKLHTKT